MEYLEVNHYLSLSKNIDCDGDIELETAEGCESFSKYINKQDAINIINHLQKVFEIDSGDLQ